MKQLNRYYRYAKISERKTRQIIKYFALDLTAQKTALLTDLTRKSINQIYLKIRNRVAEECERASPFASCQIEVDESYFGARRVRVKSADAVQAARLSSSEFINVTALSLLKLSRTCKRKRCKTLFAARFRSTRWFTRICGAATTVWWMSATANICGSITRTMFSPSAITTSTASKVSGLMLNDACTNSMEYRKKLSICI